MALTKLTKHIVHGATIVQVRYKDFADMNFNNTGTENDWDSITLTPQYADSILECHFSGVVATPTHPDSAEATMYLDINGTNEYTIVNVSGPGSYSFSFTQFGQREGDSVSMFHRHLPGSTNLQTMKIQMSKNNTNGGTTYCYDGFFCAKEVAAGVTSGTPGNNFVN